MSAPEVLKIPVEEVEPFDMVAEGRRVYRLVHGIFDFSHWPTHHRGPGIQLHVATAYMEVDTVELADGTKHELKRPAYDDPEVLLYPAGVLIQVIRGGPWPTRGGAHIDGDPS